MPGRPGDVIPVIVAAADLANKDPECIEPAVTLARRAAELAAAGRGVLLDRLDAVYAPPASVFATRSLADELGDALGVTGPRVSYSFSGAAPLALLAQACEAVVRGEARVALVAGAVAEASIKRGAARGIDVGPQAASWSQGSAAERPLDRDDPKYRHFRGAETGAGVTSPAEIFALIESSLMDEAGRTPDKHREFLGELMAPFTAMAARRPDTAWFPVARTPAELSTPSADNRMIAEPYPKRMNAFPTVDLASAVFVTTDAQADELGIPGDRRVYPWGAGRCGAVSPSSGWPVMHRPRALTEAVDAALRIAGLGVDDCTAFDLYSCFPAAVQMGMGALGLQPGDPRGLTLTGGLPYFGGPGANYVGHAIVAAVERCLTSPAERAMVVGVGGMPSDFAATVFAAVPPTRPWAVDWCEHLEAELEAERVQIDNAREGRAVVEAMTVTYDRDRGPVRAPAVVRFADGVRCGARVALPTEAAALAGSCLVGQEVDVRQVDGHGLYRIA
jgi:acetyl-CoA C-acetyltransferase